MATRRRIDFVDTNVMLGHIEERAEQGWLVQAAVPQQTERTTMHGNSVDRVQKWLLIMERTL